MAALMTSLVLSEVPTPEAVKLISLWSDCGLHVRAAEYIAVTAKGVEAKFKCPTRFRTLIGIWASLHW